MKGIIAGALLTASFCSQSSLIAHNQFIDLEQSTVDKNTNLEWLDVTHTRGMSYNELEDAMLNETAGLEGRWRLANETEFGQLLFNWFNISLDPREYRNFSIEKEDLVESFIITFGDTFDPVGDPANFGFEVSETGAGYTNGFIESNSSVDKMFLVMVGDWEFIPSDDRVRLVDYDDHLSQTSDSSKQGVSGNSSRGFFLVRDYIAVSEPSAIFSLIFLLLSLTHLNRKKLKPALQNR